MQLCSSGDGGGGGGYGEGFGRDGNTTGHAQPAKRKLTFESQKGLPSSPISRSDAEKVTGSVTGSTLPPSLTVVLQPARLVHTAALGRIERAHVHRKLLDVADEQPQHAACDARQRSHGVQNWCGIGGQPACYTWSLS